MARKKKQAEAPPGAPLFMATYGDMVTLLLCFFVLLYSFSTIDAKKFEAMASSMQTAFNPLTGGRTTDSPVSVQDGALGQGQGTADVKTTGQKMEISHQVLALVREAIKSERLEDEIQIESSERGVAISMSEQLLFDESSAVLHPEAARILYKIGGILSELPNQISVEGHTDDLFPAGSPYGDNWALSSARAATVASYMDGEIGITADRLQAVGLGASHPVVPNDSLAHRELNRRVDMVILSEYSIR